MFLEKIGAEYWPGLFEIRNHALRELLDLQYRSIVLLMRRRIRENTRRITRVLDVGAGRSPYRSLFSPDASYQTLDNAAPADFASLSSLPAHSSFDLILLIETLEHVCDPDELLRALSARLTRQGELWVSVPFAARVHGAPEDHWRWTPVGLRNLLEDSGFRVEFFQARGSDMVSLVARIAIACFRRFQRPATAPLALFAGLLTLPWMLPLAHLALARGWGLPEDPLGYFVVCRKED